MRRIALASLLGAWLFCAASGAAIASYPGQRPAESPTLDRIVGAGMQFWARRGVDTAAMCPGGVSVSVAATLRGADTPDGFEVVVVGRGGNCALVLLESDVSAMLRAVHRRRAWWREDVQELCGIAWHELGHAFDLDHSAWPAAAAVHFYPVWETYTTPEGLINGRFIEPRPPLVSVQAARLMAPGSRYFPPGCRRVATALMRHERWRRFTRSIQRPG